MPDSKRSIDDLFPPPSADEWYRRLLSIPFAYQCTVDGSILRRITSVAVYLDPQSKTTQREIMQCNRFIEPPLLRPPLIGGVGWISEDADPPFTREALSNAIGIVLEAPLMSGLAGADSDTWNHDLLFRDLPDDAPTWALSGEALRNERLDNVVFELSPLDSTMFANGPKMVRAVWILRREGKLVIGLFQQSGDEFILAGPLEIRFDQQARRLALHVLGEAKRIDFLSHWPYVGMPLMTCLYVLRHLSSSAVLSAVSSFQISVGDQTSILFSVSRGAARLVRGSQPGAPRRWYVVRDSKNLEEFFTVPEASSNMLKVDTRGSYADLDGSELQAQAERIGGALR